MLFLMSISLLLVTLLHCAVLEPYGSAAKEYPLNGIRQLAWVMKRAHALSLTSPEVTCSME